ncbi:MAG: B12-binding domain-containing radical SAM protein [Sedimentisphaerales bacterium]|nr:B12-binding domain-containing radical SAM protein [Sedimentisphaerales bacterium]
MKVLLIAPPGIEAIKSDLARLIHEERGVNPPIGLLYVATSIRENSNHEVEVLDASVDKLSIEQIGEKIKKSDPDIVGMTLSTFSLLECIRIAKLAKEIDPKTRVIVGGIHVYIYPRETIELGCFDYGVLGEAEHSIIRILDKIEKNESLSGIKGIVYKENGNIIETGQPELITDLDSIAFPDRTLLPYKRYNSLIAKVNPISIMITSRGCPCKCVFCDRPHLGKHFRVRSADNVVDEFEDCYKLGIKEILVYDDTFTINQQRVIDICKKIIERDIKIYWGIRARVDTVNEEMLGLLKKAGCVRINYGVESGDPEVLRGLKKGITLEQVEKAFYLTKKHGIDALAYFMIGCPGDTKKTIEETLRFAKKIKPSYAHFTILMPFPSTKVYADALQKGFIKRDFWREFARNPVSDFEIPVYEEHFKRHELVKLLGQCNRRFYFRLSYIIRELFKKRTPSQFCREARAALKVLMGRI